MPISENRREFLRKLVRSTGRLLGIAAGVGAGRMADAEDLDLTLSSREQVNVVGRYRLLDTEPYRIIEKYIGAPTGTLNYYYQLFWPIYIRGDEARKVQEMKDACEQALKEQRHPGALAVFERRVYNLPAMAAVHALGSASGEEVGALQDFITQTHRDIFKIDTNPNPTLSDIIWQNMTNALIRNEQSWQSFRAGVDLIRQAGEVCQLFLKGGDFALFFSALGAWQFLLTYERALYPHLEPSVESESQEIHTAYVRVKEYRRSPHFTWFNELERLYSHRLDYQQMLAQPTEMLMGRQYLTNLRDRDAADLFVLARLQNAHAFHLMAAGRLHSEYWKDVEYLKNLEHRTFTILRNYGVTPHDWPTLRHRAEQMPLAQDTLTFLDHSFARYDEVFSQSSYEDQDKDAGWLARLVPFRKLDEEYVAQQAYGRQLLGTIQNAASVDGLVESWKSSAEYGAEYESTHQGSPSLDIAIPHSSIEQGLAELAKMPEYNEDRRILRSEVRSILSSKSMPAVRACQYLDLKKSQGICGKRLQGRGRARYCDEHSSTAQAERKREKNREYMRKWRKRQMSQRKNQDQGITQEHTASPDVPHHLQIVLDALTHTLIGTHPQLREDDRHWFMTEANKAFDNVLSEKKPRQRGLSS